ncbi:NACHT, LRR and PYD domains-containing protein 12-like [Alligator mississippiensis]|uniref:NACHT, LRR and PYD domains-containing protein 3 n=1 Tax=Alligator mississippiensis TaxID=8496 RepID=A0A151ND83_ALLMI|nr:NACHT, LRR and PYD domains-containing protein 12-like [Alligator mississippiensis]
MAMQNRKLDILPHLQELTEENFKEFRYWLCSLALDDKFPVRRSKLDKADCVDVAGLLREHYGEERAVDAAIETFKMINRRDLAGKLQAEKDRALGPDQTRGRRAEESCEFRYEALNEDVSRSQNWSPPEQETHLSICLLCQALKDPRCKVKRLRLRDCKLTDACCGDLAAVLSTSPNLMQLDLSGNGGLGVCGVQLLCKGLKYPSCKLQTLRLRWCRLTTTCCGDLAAALSTSPSLTLLDLSGNTGLGDVGVRLLCEGLRRPSCKLQTLRLQCWHLTDACCEDLATALSTSPSLTELDLGVNSGLGDGGVQLLCEGLRHPSCKLQTLRLQWCRLTDACCEDLAAALSTSPSLTVLDLSYNRGLGDGSMQQLCQGLRHPSCKLQTLGLQSCRLTVACCQDLTAAVSTSPSLTQLDLSYNKGLGDGGVRLLCEGLRHPSCKVQTLRLSLHELNAETKQELEAVKGMKPGLVIEQLEEDVFDDSADW